MTWRKLTQVAVTTAVGVLLVYELVTKFWGPQEALISPVVATFFAGSNAAQFFFGGLSGHFVFTRRKWMPWPPPPDWGLFVLLGLLSVCAGFDLETAYRADPEIFIPASMVLGHLLWAQDPPQS